MVSVDIKRDNLTTTDRNWSPPTHTVDGPFTDSLTEQPSPLDIAFLEQALSIMKSNTSSLISQKTIMDPNLIEAFVASEINPQHK
jgi:hypothetical protein